MCAVLKKIQIFKEKDLPGEELQKAYTVEGHGIYGDRHCMDAEKPISISDETLEKWINEQEYKGLCFRRFKTNLILENLSQLDVKVGDKIKIGDTVLEISGAYKKCFKEGCEIYENSVPCRLPGNMLFAVSLDSGEMNRYDAVEKL